IDLMTIDGDGLLAPVDSLPLPDRIGGLALEPRRGLAAFSLPKSDKVEGFVSVRRGTAFRAPGAPFNGEPGRNPGALLLDVPGRRLFAGTRNDPADVMVFDVVGSGSLTRDPITPVATDLVGIASLAEAPDGRLYAAPLEGDTMELMSLSGPSSF